MLSRKLCTCKTPNMISSVLAFSCSHRSSPGCQPTRNCEHDDPFICKENFMVYLTRTYKSRKVLLTCEKLGLTRKGKEGTGSRQRAYRWVSCKSSMFIRPSGVRNRKETAPIRNGNCCLQPGTTSTTICKFRANPNCKLDNSKNLHHLLTSRWKLTIEDIEKCNIFNLANLLKTWYPAVLHPGIDNNLQSLLYMHEEIKFPWTLGFIELTHAIIE